MIKYFTLLLILFLVICAKAQNNISVNAETALVELAKSTLKAHG